MKKIRVVVEVAVDENISTREMIEAMKQVLPRSDKQFFWTKLGQARRGMVYWSKAAIKFTTHLR